MTRQEELDRIAREKLLLDKQDELESELKDLRREVLILRKGQELSVYGEEVEENEDVEGIPDKEVEDE